MPEKLGQADSEKSEPVPAKAGKVDPLVCPKCHGTMRIISFIEDEAVVKAILDHLGLCPIRSRPPAMAHAPPSRHNAAVDFDQPIPDNNPSGDPDYPWDAYIPKKR